MPGDPPVNDPDEPSCARVFNYWLGGTDNTGADRALADEIEKIDPSVRRMVWNNRRFAGHSVRWAAHDVAQFADLGCGIPPGEQTHQAARSVRPAATCAYVDHDPEVTDYMDAAFDGHADDGVAVVRADITHAGPLFADPGMRRVIDLDAPVCLLFALVLHFWQPADARDLMAEYTRLIAPGSHVAISCLRIDDETLWEQLSEAYTPYPLRNFTREQFAALFDGLQIEPPGIVPVMRLLPAELRAGWYDTPRLRKSLGPAYVVGAVARKPF